MLGVKGDARGNRSVPKELCLAGGKKGDGGRINPLEYKLKHQKDKHFEIFPETKNRKHVWKGPFVLTHQGQ